MLPALLAAASRQSSIRRLRDIFLAILLSDSKFTNRAAGPRGREWERLLHDTSAGRCVYDWLTNPDIT
jgi:hypothetical protein